MTALPAPLPYVGLEELGDHPHVIVDGAPRPGSVCVLSHWPVSTTPVELARDISAEIALAYLAGPSFWAADAVAVTNDHFDADGLAAMYALVDPPAAVARRDQLVGLARMGDFGVATSREIARTAFALRSLTDRETSPFVEAEEGVVSPISWTTHCYANLLKLLPALLDRVDDFRSQWEEEDEGFEASLEARRTGALEIRQEEDLSLAVATLGSASPVSGQFFLGHGTSVPIHPAVLNSATPAVRVLLIHGHRYWYYDRYETWVRYVSRPLSLRRDLAPLASELTAAEHEGAVWRAGSANGIEPVLSIEDDRESTLVPEEVVARLRRHLVEDPPAWDPFQPGGRPVETNSEDRLSEAAASRAGTSGRGRPRWRDRRRARPSA